MVTDSVTPEQTAQIRIVTDSINEKKFELINRLHHSLLIDEDGLELWVSSISAIKTDKGLWEIIVSLEPFDMKRTIFPPEWLTQIYTVRGSIELLDELR